MLHCQLRELIKPEWGTVTYSSLPMPNEVSSVAPSGECVLVIGNPESFDENSEGAAVTIDQLECSSSWYLWVLHQGPHYSIKFNFKRRTPPSSLTNRPLLYSCYKPFTPFLFKLDSIYNNDAAITKPIVTLRHGLRNTHLDTRHSIHRLAPLGINNHNP
jgi:hypothetical protein